MFIILTQCLRFGSSILENRRLISAARIIQMIYGKVVLSDAVLAVRSHVTVEYFELLV